MLRNLVFLSLLLCVFASRGQDSTVNTKRLKTLVVSNSVAYIGGITGLYQLWYRNYPLGSFHFFNDNAEWNQMDKVGHAYSCYQEGMVGIDMLRWAGVENNKAIWIGGSYGLLWQSTIEILDGFSEEWGASLGDIASNFIGTGLVIGQELGWEEQRIVIKWSYHNTEFAPIRPNVLGNSFTERVFKDYNGQTYWLSMNINSFTKTNKLPDWLNLALGYGIDGFVGGHDNIFESEGVNYDYSYLTRQRQFYLSADIDFSRIPTKNSWAKAGLRVLNSLKLPFPALEYNSQTGNFRFIPLYF